MYEGFDLTMLSTCTDIDDMRLQRLEKESHHMMIMRSEPCDKVVNINSEKGGV